MILVLLLVVSLVLTVHSIWHVIRTHRRVHDHRFGNWVVGEFFGWMRSSISMLTITLAIAVMMIAEAAFGEVSETWETVVVVVFVVVAILAMFITLLFEAVARNRMETSAKRDDTVA